MVAQDTAADDIAEEKSRGALRSVTSAVGDVKLGSHWAIEEFYATEGPQWACADGVGGEARSGPPLLVSDWRDGDASFDSKDGGAVVAALMGSICARSVQPGVLPLGELPVPAGEGGATVWHPLAPVRGNVLGAPERPDREDLPKYDRVVPFEVGVDGKMTVAQADGIVARLQLGGVAWLRTELRGITLDHRLFVRRNPDPEPEEEAEAQPKLTPEMYKSVGCRRAGSLVICEGVLPPHEYRLGMADIVIGTLPHGYRPHGGRRAFLSVCQRGDIIHLLGIYVDSSGKITCRRSHGQGRARDGHIFEAALSKKHPGYLEQSLGCMRFCTRPGHVLELLAEARAPRQFAARKQLAYLGLEVSDNTSGDGTQEDLDGYQIATCSRYDSLVILEGAVIISTRHRYTAFCQLPEDCRPARGVTVLVARGLPAQGRLVPERLTISANGECVCPQLPDKMGEEHYIHFSGACFAVSNYPDSGFPAERPAAAPQKKDTENAYGNGAWENWQGAANRDKEKWNGKNGSGWNCRWDGGGKWGGRWDDRRRGGGGWDGRQETEEEAAWRRMRELEQRERRFRGKFHSGAEFIEFEKTLQWFRAHDCTESHRLTHSCFKGRSDFTQTGMLVFDTEEDLEGLNKAIAWLYERRVPVVLMERQTRIFPMIFDIDLKCTNEQVCDAVPDRIKNARPWRGPVDFCLWHGADYLVLTGDLLLLRHLGKIIFQFFPDLPLMDICVFNASGWDRIKGKMKVSIHLVCPYVLVTPDRLCAIRERMLEYLGETSEHKGHPLQQLLETYLAEAEDNTWDKVVDQTVTSGTNGLRMPYCDKAHRVLKREFQERKDAGEIFTERELQDKHAYMREEAGRPCLPEGILRLTPPPIDADERALPSAKWMCRGGDLPIDEWIRLGRCRYAWRLPLAPAGPTPWRPPLKYQWAEPASLWEDRADLKGSPVVRIFYGTAAEFRFNWDSAQRILGSRLQGGWLACGSGARWRGGLNEGACHEVRYIARASRVVLLLAPEEGSARTFAEIRRVMSGWTEPDDIGCVPLCGNLTDSHSAALHTVITPSDEFPDVHTALDSVPVDEPLHRVLIKAGEYDLPDTLVVRGPVLLEGEGRWETVLRTRGVPVLRFKGEGARAAMIRNLRIEVLDDESGKSGAGGGAAGDGATAVEIHLEGVKTGEPAIVGCCISAAGRWGCCVRAWGSSPQVVRNRFSHARWGVIYVDADGRVEDNEFLGLGEAGLTLIGGAPWIHRNTILFCGGPGILVYSDCHGVLEVNEVKDCLSGVRVIGKRSDLEMRYSEGIFNRMIHNGLTDEHQLEVPPGVVPRGSTATVRSCRPYPFLPQTQDELFQRLRECNDHQELTVLIRAARRGKYWVEAAKAHKRLRKLWEAKPKNMKEFAAPSQCETGVASESWDGRKAGYGDKCISVQAGAICEIWRRDASGWLLVATSEHSKGWCSPHVLS